MRLLIQKMPSYWNGRGEEQPDSDLPDIQMIYLPGKSLETKKVKKLLVQEKYLDKDMFPAYNDCLTVTKKQAHFMGYEDNGVSGDIHITVIDE
jgi:hypothetical protein